jgi:hypothetical protein
MTHHGRPKLQNTSPIDSSAIARHYFGLGDHDDDSGGGVVGGRVVIRRPHLTIPRDGENDDDDDDIETSISGSISESSPRGSGVRDEDDIPS